MTDKAENQRLTEEIDEKLKKYNQTSDEIIESLGEEANERIMEELVDLVEKKKQLHIQSRALLDERFKHQQQLRNIDDRIKTQLIRLQSQSDVSDVLR